MTLVPISGTGLSVDIHADTSAGKYRLLAGFPGGEQRLLADAPVPTPGGDPNLFVWTSDWHIGRSTSYPARIDSVVDRILSLQPAGVIDTGDCKEDWGAGSASQLDDYITQVRYRIPWAASEGAPLPILPGNHDELYDYQPAGSPTNFSLWDPRMWPAPYHWTADWASPKIRFIGLHTTIKHENPLWGFAQIQASETNWLEDELDTLPAGWQAIVCSHYPANPAFGNEIRPELGGAALRALLSANAGKIVAYLNGHRHANMQTSTMNNVVHFNGPGVAYTMGNGNGAYVEIKNTGNSLVFTQRYAISPFAPLGAPVTIGI